MRIVPLAALALLALSTLLPAARALEPPTAVSPEEQVAAVLRDQAEAWSRGDLEAFTSVYAEDAAFLTASGLTAAAVRSSSATRSVTRTKRRWGS